MFKEERDQYLFNWDMIGDILLGRPNLGEFVNLAAYRLLQFTIRDTLIKNFDAETAAKIYFESGELAGKEFCKNLLNKELEAPEFINQAQKMLSELKIGILRIEEADFENFNFTVTVAEDVDCSGLPVCDETICTYDEGFLCGLMSEFSGREFSVKEVDCWCSGERVCRFKINALN